MQNDQPKSPHPRPLRQPYRWRRWILRAALLLSVAAIVAAALLHHYWPFTQAEVVSALQETFDGTVTFEHFHGTFFPFPGCIAEGVVLQRASRGPKLPPLATAKRLQVKARYTDLLFRPGYLALIRVDGLHIQAPLRGSTVVNANERLQHAGSRTRVGEVIADGTLLEVARPNDDNPLRFEIHAATLFSLTPNGHLSYRIAFHNPLPPGEIHSTGTFGPWNFADAAQTPVSGNYTFDHADLSVFPGIAGTLSSKDDFQGVLQHIETHGSVDVPDFEIDRSSHPVPLHSTFHAVVNGTNGDVILEKVTSTLVHTAITTKGRITGTPNGHGKTTSLDFSVRQGHIQDFLRLLARRPTPALTGTTTFAAHVTVPPEGRPFLQELQIDGDFNIDEGHFTSADTQTQIDNLSQSSSGKKPEESPEGPPENVISGLQGHVHLRDGIATLTGFSLWVPGAHAKVSGTYNLINEKVDFHGVLGTDAKLSQTTSGFKSILLKPFDSLFKGRKRAAVVPVKLTGTYSNPEAGFDIMGKGKEAAHRQPPAQ
jgi:hypothetical protein